MRPTRRPENCFGRDHRIWATAPCSWPGPCGVFGPPKDHGAALAVLREALQSGVNHIDTSDFYGPHITNQLIREALHPYPAELVIVTKISARRGADGSWLPAMSPEELTQAVHDNLRNLGPRCARGGQPAQHVRHCTARPRARSRRR
jgi:hypothetical protein